MKSHITAKTTSDSKPKSFFEEILNDVSFRKNLVGVYRSLLDAIGNAIEKAVLGSDR